MPVNNFTIGRDVALVIQTPNGQLNVPGITDFTADPIVAELKSKPLSGIPQYGYIPDGWSISVKIDRMDATVDNFWAQFEAAYYAGGNQVGGTIFETIREQDGSVSQWRYTGVVLKLAKAGDFSGDKKVEQTLTGMASQKIRVS
jgi:hypothetical protein